MIPFVDSCGGVVTPIACVFDKGAVTTDQLVVVDQPNLHVRVLAKWNDGSAKHAIIVGMWEPGSGDNTLQIATGTPDAGSPPTITRPTDVVQLGGESLALADATLHRTYLSTPDFIETHYRAKSGTLYVWWYLRTWSDGTQWLGRKLENNRSPDGTDGYVHYTDSIVLGAYSDTPAKGLWPNRAIYSENWVSPATDPGTVYKHDPLALQRSKLVENWIRRDNGKDEDNTNAYTTFPTEYVQFTRGNALADWSGGGYKPHLGIHSKWEATMAKYADSRGMAAGKINALCLSMWPCVIRDPTSHNAPKCTEIGVRESPVIKFPDPPADDGLGLIWDCAHNVNSGYVPWLLTGDFRFWETMAQHSAAIVYYTSNNGANSATRALSNGESRGIAWELRQIGQMLACAPEQLGHTDINAFAAEYRTLLGTNIGYWLDAGVDDIPPAGIISDWHPGNPLGLAFGGATMPVEKFGEIKFANFFMPAYGVFSAAHILDIEACSDADNASKVLPFMLWQGKFPVGVLDVGGTGHFDWTQVFSNPTTSRYWQVCSAQGGTRPDFSNVYPDWGTVYNVNVGEWTTPGTSLVPVPKDDPPGGYFTISESTVYYTDGSWLLHAISKCVDYGVPGAEEAFNRLIGADNFADCGGDNSFMENPDYDEYIGYGATPTEGIVPRSWIDGVQPTAPAWYTALTQNIYTDTGLRLPDPSITAYSGGCINTVGVYDGADFIPGTFVIVYGGGHGDSSNNGVYAVGPLQGTPSVIQLSRNTAPVNVNWDAEVFPVSTHTYQSLVFLPDVNRMLVTGSGSRFNDSEGDLQSYFFDFTLASPMTGNPWIQGPNNTGTSTDAMAGYDPISGTAWNVRNSGRLMQMAADLTYWIDRGLKGLVTGSTGAATHPTKQVAVLWWIDKLYVYNLNSGVLIGPITVTGDVPTWSAGNYATMTWSETRGAYACHVELSAAPVFWFTPPADHTSTEGWSCAEESGAGGDSSAPASAGTFGRFAAVDDPFVPGLILIDTGGRVLYRPVA